MSNTFHAYMFLIFFWATNRNKRSKRNQQQGIPLLTASVVLLGLIWVAVRATIHPLIQVRERADVATRPATGRPVRLLPCSCAGPQLIGGPRLARWRRGPGSGGRSRPRRRIWPRRRVRWGLRLSGRVGRWGNVDWADSSCGGGSTIKEGGYGGVKVPVVALKEELGFFSGWRSDLAEGADQGRIVARVSEGRLFGFILHWRWRRLPRSNSAGICSDLLCWLSEVSVVRSIYSKRCRFGPTVYLLQRSVSIFFIASIYPQTRHAFWPTRPDMTRPWRLSTFCCHNSCALICSSRALILSVGVVGAAGGGDIFSVRE